MKIKKNDKIFIAGHNGLVGSAILRKLKKNGYKNLLVVNKNKLDLIDQQKVFKFLEKNKPKLVIIAAAKVGGIQHNNIKRAEFIYENLMIEANLIHGCYINGIKNLILLGSSCVYPRDCKQPIKEEYLLSGYLEKTNEPYAIAKIAGIKMCENYNRQYKTKYKCLMPTNTFGPNDTFDTEKSHFIPAIILKILDAKRKKLKKLKVWGNGEVKREVIYVDDLADAIVFFMNKNFKGTTINIGSNIEHKIIDYVKIICKIMNFKGKLVSDLTKPSGTPRKKLSLKKINKFNWKAKTSLEDGLNLTIKSLMDSGLYK
jgi:GDP-L-fucose synthase